MTNELMNIWKHVDRIGDLNLADEIENALDEAQDKEGFLAVFFRGFEIGTSGAEVEEMTWNW